MKNFKIRKLKKSDYKQADCLLMKLHELHVKNRHDIFTPVKHYYTKKQWKKRMKDKNYIYYGMFDDEKLIGMIGMAFGKFNNIIIPQICALYILPEYRSQHIAKRLMKKCQKYCCKHFGNTSKFVSDYIELNVCAFNKSAIEFYKKMGFNFRCHIMEYKFK